MAVNKDDIIQVAQEHLHGEGIAKVTVKWNQNLRQRSVDYIVCKFSSKSNGSPDSVLFVQSDRFNDLPRMSIGDYMFRVDSNFQYGQKKDKTARFLVYHDKENKMYQHRFFESMVTLYEREGFEFLGGFEFRVRGVDDVVSDYLKDFQ